MSTSPGGILWPFSSPSRPQRATVAAMRDASRMAGEPASGSSSGLSHASRSGAGHRLFDLPHLDEAGDAAAGAFVRPVGQGRRRTGPVVFQRPEHRIDSLQHVRRRAEGELQRLVVKAPTLLVGFSKVAETFPEVPARLLEGLRSRALEGIDRLLGIADRKQRARPPATSLARDEVLCDGAKDAPLRLAGVLGLVDEDVVDALVQLVEHPSRIGLAAKQVAG